jgi:hypothetical protein
MAPTFEMMRDRLPTLYRPAGDDRTGLLPLVLRTVAAALDEADRDAGNVMQTHWFAYADRALTSPFFARARQVQHLPLPTQDDLRAFPYIDDLARLAAIFPLLPWRDPATSRETVEEYRDRIRRTVILYREGLGTLDAVRRMVEVQLPVSELSAKQRDRPVWLEEFAPIVRQTIAIAAPGSPFDLVGPMMRWTVANPGLAPVTPAIYIQGIAPSADTAATERPLIELYQHDATFPRLGIAYNDTIAPGTTLRLRPAFASWLALDTGIQRADALPADDNLADPTAPGPWQAVADPEAPAAAVTAMIQTHDRALWITMNADGAGELRRYDGQSWTVALTGLPPLDCLAEDGQDLLIGTESGLLRLPLYPESDQSFTTTPVPGFDGRTIRALLHASDGGWWIGADDGAFQIDTPDTTLLAGCVVFAISEDRSGALFFGTDRGLFQFQPSTGDWYWYEGKERSEQNIDWQPLALDALPAADQGFLPPVRAVHRGPDASLWIGTERGIARYLARAAHGLTFETVLEAFPELTDGVVYTIAEDARGLIWFGTIRGLFRFDGRDFWQFQQENDEWLNLGRADTFYDAPADLGESEPAPRRAWRFLRVGSIWQRSVATGRGWANVVIDPAQISEPRATDQPAVHAIIWTDRVVANLGTWDGSQFSTVTPVDPSRLEIRYKPDATRILSGGIPAIPALPPGSSVWRYLSREPEDMSEPTDRPAWTSEGRLLPEPRPETPDSGRFDRTAPPPGNYDETIFAFDPAARVWFAFGARQPLTLLVRLAKRTTDEQIDPAILDRVWQGIQQVRPAGVRAMLAVAETIVRGGDDATG